MVQRVWTPQELELMTPAEQDALFEAGLVRDLNAAPQDFVERVRERFLDRVARGELTAG
jgi:hypothetical protein